MSEKTEEFLEHHGIPGMKWGVRKAGRSIISRKAKNRAKTRPSDEGAQAQKILAKQKKYGTVALTNHELRVVNARIKLEQDFAKGVPPKKTNLQKGKKFVDDMFTYDEKLKKFSGGKGFIDMVAKGKKAMTAKPTP